MSNAFAKWELGDLTNEQALNALCSELGEVESEIEPLKREQQDLRDKISQVLDRAGGKAEVAGFGRIEITAPAIVTGYDRQKLDDLIVTLAAEGHSKTAQQIARCRTQSQRAGSLRITREKGSR